MIRLVVMSAAIVSFACGSGLAVPSISEGQTVFLPSFRNFFYRGAVQAPDGGSIQLGGVKRSAEQSVANGVPGLGNVPGLGRGFKNRGIGREQNSGMLTVNPRIIILEELEAQLLAESGLEGEQAANEEVRKKAAFLSRHVGRNSQSSGGSGNGTRSWGKRR